ncbi:MAG: hypothetical protein HYX69_15225 [Planctomycetia bacterium]|nr:hypothetical protein [Planctomycetia bacterium]
MADAQPKPRRRWFQFRLRTMFLLVTLFALWLGWQVNLARQRIAFREALFAKGGYVEWDSSYEFPPIPSFREWFLDDYPVQKIRVPYMWEAEFRADAKRLFPEATYLPLSQQELDENEAAERERLEREKNRTEGSQ